MKRKTPVPPIESIDILLSLAPTLEALDIPDDDTILAARDFSGIPYYIFTTKNAARFDVDTIRAMVDSRCTMPRGRRTFVGDDDRIIAIDIHRDTLPHIICSYDGTDVRVRCRSNAEGFFDWK